MRAWSPISLRGSPEGMMLFSDEMNHVNGISLIFDGCRFSCRKFFAKTPYGVLPIMRRYRNEINIVNIRVRKSLDFVHDGNTNSVRTVRGINKCSAFRAFVEIKNGNVLI